MGVGAVYSILLRQARSMAEGMPSEAEVEKMREDMLEELKTGAYCRVDMHQFVAQKKA